MNSSDDGELNELSREYLEKKEDFVIKDNIDYPDPEYLIAIRDTPTMPRGNLVALSAKWKNGKTFFCDIISAVFLGTDRFPGLRSLRLRGKVQVFDTEQAVSDTARIRNIIKRLTGERRNEDFEVFCLRNALIDKINDDDKEVSRYEFIEQSIKHYNPDLVIIDGIADLIYNYNDVIESQQVVNNLAALANEMNCCIVVVMHQNKSRQDKSMKGHLGTMLFQKCSDVFNIEKVSNLFIVSHAVSRHRQCDDFIFKIDAEGIPEDASADKREADMLRQQQEGMKVADAIKIVMTADEEIKRKDIVKRMTERGICGSSQAYKIVNEAIENGVIVTRGGVLYSIAAQHCSDLAT